ncbi:hypothetical protein BDR26DRAFT_855444 [Obelidium mucronatum]|nr:hypothetical protein BDR26DRAFT_855444 [Obelidium mucronatum]
MLLALVRLNLAAFQQRRFLLVFENMALNPRNVSRMCRFFVQARWMIPPTHEKEKLLGIKVDGSEVFSVFVAATLKAGRDCSVLKSLQSLTLRDFLISPTLNDHNSALFILASQCMKLESLYLENPVRHEHPLNFLKLFSHNSITSLTISGISLSAVPLKLASYLPKLKSLTLSHVDIKSVGNMRSMDSFTNLQSLHLLNLEARFTEDVAKLVAEFIKATSSAGSSGLLCPLVEFGLTLSSTKCMRAFDVSALPQFERWICQISIKSPAPLRAYKLLLGYCSVSVDFLNRVISSLSCHNPGTDTNACRIFLENCKVEGDISSIKESLGSRFQIQP